MKASWLPTPAPLLLPETRSWHMNQVAQLKETEDTGWPVKTIPAEDSGAINVMASQARTWLHLPFK